MTVTSDRAAPSNKGLVYEGGNQYENPYPFFGMPTWWRRFMFTVLSPRDFIIYAYICSHTDQFGISYPTYANMKADLNISNARIIKKSLDKLDTYGFLLIRRFAPLRVNKHPRNVYQRPCVEYTVRVLLSKNIVDADLRSRHRADAARKGDPSNRDSQAIHFGLRRLFTDAAWNRIVSSTPQDKVTALTRELQSIIDQRRLKWENEDAPQISAADRAAAEATLYANADDDAEYSAFPDDVSAFDRAETTPAEDDENPF